MTPIPKFCFSFSVWKKKHQHIQSEISQIFQREREKEKINKTLTAAAATVIGYLHFSFNIRASWISFQVPEKKRKTKKKIWSVRYLPSDAFDRSQDRTNDGKRTSTSATNSNSYRYSNHRDWEQYRKTLYSVIMATWIRVVSV